MKALKEEILKVIRREYILLDDVAEEINDIFSKYEKRPLITFHQIDFNFIEKLEGVELKGYVPDPENSNSGVTIASGFDLGQRTGAELIKAFDPSLSIELVKYAGLKRQDAVKALGLAPLEITEDECSHINQYAKMQAVDNLVKLWEKSDSKVDFFDLAPACQTVIASVAFQYGNLEKATPNFWRQVTNQLWKGAYTNLCNFGDNYGTRRNKEAGLLYLQKPWKNKK